MTLEKSGAAQAATQPATQPATRANTRKRADQTVSVDPKEGLERMLLNAHRLAVSLGDWGVFRNGQLSVAEWAILKVLGDRQDVPINQISGSTGVSRQRLHKLISELEQKGLVLTGRSSTEDKRVRMISATPTAAQVLSLISRQMQELVPEAPIDRHRQGRLLDTAARSLEKVSRSIRRNWQAGRANGIKTAREADHRRERAANERGPQTPT